MEQFISYINFTSPVTWLIFSMSALISVTLILFHKQKKQLLLQSVTIQSLQQDLHALANAAVGVGGRVLKIERQQRNQSVGASVKEVPDKTVELNAPVDFYNVSNQPYEQAIRMAQKGVDAETIANVTGLSQSETELVCVMHRLDKVS